MNNKWILFVLLAFIFGCSRNAITGRNQISLYPESDMQSMAVDQYRQFLRTNKVISPTGNPDAEMVQRVGQRLVTAINNYYDKHGLSRELQGYQWEFHLVASKEVNAWCMPGGKIVVYTGLLPVTENEATLAIVLGHEIAHTLAQHGNERMSQASVQELGGVALSVSVINQPAATQNLFLNAYGINSNMGVSMPFSHKQELEADRLGLLFAALAAYDPQESIPFWERMKATAGSNQPPELISTHPIDGKRMEKLKEEVTAALNSYQVNANPKVDPYR